MTRYNVEDAFDHYHGMEGGTPPLFLEVNLIPAGLR